MFSKGDIIDFFLIFIVGGGLSIFWKTENAYLLLNGSKFYNNVATYGGAIDLSHTQGKVDINNNIILNNTGFNPGSGLGTSACIKGSTGTNVPNYLYKNTFINNFAFAKGSFNKSISHVIKKFFPEGNLNFVAGMLLDFYSLHIYGKTAEGTYLMALQASKLVVVGARVLNLRAAKGAACLNIREMSYIKISHSYFEVEKMKYQSFELKDIL